MSVRDDEDLRPPRRTPNLGLPVPGDAGPADYVTDTGKLADALDEGGAFFFPGDLKLSAARAAPPGWLVCDGRSVSRTIYAALFSAIGDVWGADDDDTFRVPDFRRRMPLGASPTGPAIGEPGGTETVTLSVAEMPHHAHGVADGGHAHVPAAGGAFVAWGSVNFNVLEGGGLYGVRHDGTTAGAAAGIGIHGEGGSQPHTNWPPYLGVNVFIKT